MKKFYCIKMKNAKICKYENPDEHCSSCELPKLYTKKPEPPEPPMPKWAKWKNDNNRPYGLGKNECMKVVEKCSDVRWKLIWNIQGLEEVTIEAFDRDLEFVDDVRIISAKGKCIK